MDHPAQGDLFRVEDGVAVFGEEIVQGVIAAFKGQALLELAAAEVDLFRCFPAGIGDHTVRRGVKYLHKLGGVGGAHVDAQLRDDHLPVGGGPVDDLQPVPDFQQLQKFPVVALDFPLLMFVQEEDVFVNAPVVFQKIPQTGDALNEEMAPVVHQVAAVDDGFVPVFGVFEGIGVLDPAGDGGKVHIVPVAVHHAAPAEQQLIVPAQGENGGIAALPDFGIFPDLHGGVVPCLQSLRFFRTQIPVVDAQHTPRLLSPDPPAERAAVGPSG